MYTRGVQLSVLPGQTSVTMLDSSTILLIQVTSLLQIKKKFFALISKRGWKLTYQISKSSYQKTIKQPFESQGA